MSERVFERANHQARSSAPFIESRRTLRAVGALTLTAIVVVGVPVLLATVVGNPWPGRSRIEMRDDVAILVGLLAALAWLVWLRFVVALVIEIRAQVTELRAQGVAPTAAHVELAAPIRSSPGVGLLAQRLVAAILILVPVATRSAPAIADGPTPLRARPADAGLDVDAMEPPQPVVSSPPVTPASGSVVVAPGDTLIGLARQHLGDGKRWREIFELNRDRPQVDGARLVTPSAIRVGWTLELPASDVAAVPPAAPYASAATITIELDDTLWDLAHEHLAGAGVNHDDMAVAGYVQAIIEANPAVVEDPNVIHVGEQFAFPAVGTPASPPAATVTSPSVASAPSITDAAPAPPPVPDRNGASGEDPAPSSTAASVTTTTTPSPLPPGGPATPAAAAAVGTSPSPIGVGEAALLSAGVLALLAARRRHRLRSSLPRARVPEPKPEMVAAERRLRSVDAGERLLRVDIAIRAAAASLADTAAQIAVVQVAIDGGVELVLTGEALLPPPWDGAATRWTLPGSTPVELLAEAARSVGAPCVALTQIGLGADGREVLVDLEALGVLSIIAPEPLADAVVRGVAATLATSIFAEVANLIGVGLDDSAFLGHRHAHTVSRVDDALELAATLVGSTAAAKQTTFVLRARHTSGEAWEPAVVLTGTVVAAEVTQDVVRSAARRRGGLAVVAAGAPGAPWCLCAADGRWTLEPLGVALVPVGLTAAEVEELHEVLRRADEPLLPAEGGDTTDATSNSEVLTDPQPDDVGDGPSDPPWSLLVRLLGSVDVVDRDGRQALFERSKTLELIAWLTLHRERSTRAGARTALWELDVRDATFANVVSEARRAMARLVEPPAGEEWLGRTLTDVLPLHDGVVSDADLVRSRLDRARLQPPELAIETLRPAVALIRDMPFAGTGYLWPDAEGITSNLVLLATGAATELAGHYLSIGDVDGVFWATGHGLTVLPGHEELIALRMRAHHRAGDLSGVRLEWECYERVLNADPWSDGEPAPKLVLLRRQLLSS